MASSMRSRTAGSCCPTQPQIPLISEGVGASLFGFSITCGETEKRSSDPKSQQIVEGFASRRQNLRGAVENHLGGTGAIQEVARHRVAVRADVAQRQDVSLAQNREAGVAGEEVPRVCRVAADIRWYRQGLA